MLQLLTTQEEEFCLTLEEGCNDQWIRHTCFIYRFSLTSCLIYLLFYKSEGRLPSSFFFLRAPLFILMVCQIGGVTRSKRARFCFLSTKRFSNYCMDVCFFRMSSRIPLSSSLSHTHTNHTSPCLMGKEGEKVVAVQVQGGESEMGNQ